VANCRNELASFLAKTALQELKLLYFTREADSLFVNTKGDLESSYGDK
jgi:hypothetical protein